MRLSDIPEDTLKQIERFVKENKKVYPVTSAPKEDGTRIKTLVDIVEEKFGYRLSPAQIYALQKGEKTYRVKLDPETIRELEDRFGSVGKGIKQMLKFFGKQQLPPHLREPYRALLKADKGYGLSPSEIEEILKPLVREEQEVWKIIQELGKLGYVTRNKKDRYDIHKFRRNPLIELSLGLG